MASSKSVHLDHLSHQDRALLKVTKRFSAYQRNLFWLTRWVLTLTLVCTLDL